MSAADPIRDDRSSLERVRSALSSHLTRERGDQLYARCPAHDDNSPSLSVTWKNTDKGGRTFMYCQTGCPVTAVCDALGLTLSDLHDTPPARPADPTRPRWTPPTTSPRAPRPRTAKKATEKDTSPRVQVAVHPYPDADGVVTCEVVRWSRANKRGGKYTTRRVVDGDVVYSAPPLADRVLYMLPMVLAAVAANAPIWVVEGEKDADALNDAFAAAGRPDVATTNLYGACVDGKRKNWRPQYTDTLAGADVVIVPDLDRADATVPYAGQRHAWFVGTRLQAGGCQVRFATAAVGKDPADHLAAGRGLDEFAPLDADELARLIDPYELVDDTTATAPAPADPGGDEPAKVLPFPQRPDADEAQGNADEQPAKKKARKTKSKSGGGRGGTPPAAATVVIRDQFEVVDGALCKVKYKRGEGEDGEPLWTREATELIPAAPRLLRRLRYDLGDGDPARVTHRDLVVDQGEETVELLEVDEKSWDKCSWVDELPHPAPITDTATGRATLRKAIVASSPEATLETLYGRLGWWEIGGRWVYLHARGAIDETGPVTDVRVNVDQKYRDFWLPAPAADVTELREAATASLEPLNRDSGVPLRLATPMLCAAWRACLGYSRVTVLPVGGPTSGKTALAAFGQQHFAPDASHEYLPFAAGEDQATVASLEFHRFVVGDMLTIVDDAAPDRGTEALGRRQNLLARSQHGRRGRDRGKRDGGNRAEHKPNGLLGVTTEQWVGLESAESRVVPMPMYVGQLDPQKVFAPLDEPGKALGRARLISTMVQHYAGQMPMTQALRKRRHETQTELIDPDAPSAGQEARRCEAFADLWCGAHFMLAMLVDRGAVTEEQAAALRALIWRGLLEAKDHMGASAQRSPHLRAGELLGSAFVRKAVALEDQATGGPPEHATLLGWDEVPMTSRGMFAAGSDDTQLRRQGTPIGWTDGTWLYLNPMATTAAIATAAKGASITWAYTHESLGQALGDARVTVTEIDKKGKRYTVRTRIQGKQMRVWKAPLTWLFPDGPDTSPDDSGDDNGSTPPPEDPAPTEPPDEQPPVDEDQALDEPASEQAPASDDDQLDDVAEPCVSCAEPCVSCAEPTARRWQGVPLHEGCVPSADDVAELTEDPAAEADTDPAETGTESPAEPSPSSVGGQPGEAVGGRPGLTGTRVHYDAPALVCSPDGAWLALPDPGQPRPLPPTVDSLPALLTWAYESFELGQAPKTLTKGARHKPGQVWVTPALRRALKLPASLNVDSEAKTENRTQRRGRELLETAGWGIAGRVGVSAFTQVYRQGGRRMHVVVPEWLEQQRGASTFGEDNPATEPRRLARQLGLYSDVVGVPYLWSPAVTGLNLVEQTRPRLLAAERPELPPPSQAANREQPYEWQRAPQSWDGKYLHCWDFNAMYLGATASLMLGYGAASHAPNATVDLAREQRVPGYWKIRAPEWRHSFLPDPVRVLHRGDRNELWVTTPTLLTLVEIFDMEVEILNAYVWDRADSGRILDKWQTRLRTARTSMADLVAAGDPDAEIVAAAVKGTYSMTLGRFASQKARKVGHRLYRPDFRHHAIAEARRSLTRRFFDIADAYDRYPIAIATDAVVYSSDEPDPTKAIPTIFSSEGKPRGGLIPGTGLGQVKHVGTVETATVAKLLSRRVLSRRELARTTYREDRTVREYGLMDTFKRSTLGR